MLNRRKVILGLMSVAATGRPATAAPFKISHAVNPIRQPSLWSCWAAAATMIYNWKLGINQEIETVVGFAGPNYVAVYNESFPPKNRGITAAEEAEFYQDLPMTVIQGLNPSIEGWYDLLVSKGPLSITVKDQPGTGTFHALVVTGLDGDGTGQGTIITYIDPDDGLSHSVNFGEFLRLYEGSASWPLQIIHNP